MTRPDRSPLHGALLALGTALLVACTGIAPRAATVQPDPAHAALELGRAQYAAGRYGLAIEHLERELARYPTSLAALNGLGACYDGLGRGDVARRYYMQALAIAPDAPQTLGNLGRSYLADGRAADAVAVLTLAAAAAPDDRWVADALARAETALAADATPPPAPATPAIVAVELAAGETASLETAAVAPMTVEPEPAAATPVAASPAVPSTPSTGTASAPSRLEVSNGNGVEGLAQAVRDWLAGERWLVTRVTNAPRFDHAVTEVQHAPGRGADADALAARLPVACRVVEATPRRADTDLRLVLGADLIAHLARGLEGPVLAWVGPRATITGTARIEVSNGNGVPGLARRVGASLRAEGAAIARITNAGSFAEPETVVMHRRDADEVAQRIAAWLPLARVRLVPTEALSPRVDVRIVLGRDLAEPGSDRGALAAAR